MRLDPEEQRDVVSAFQSCCAGEIKRFGGMVAQYLGDGVLAYFGYPAAHEDDAERAVRAGLAVLDAVGALKPAAGVTLQVRIGIASGVVVVGDLVREGVTQESAAIGETTNLAARLQSAAEPNTIVISPETHRLVEALFEYRDLGHVSAKGFAEGVHARQVLGASKVASRFEARHQSGTQALLGREEELDLLRRRWELAKRGEGRVVLLTGEPGIGKSRLARALQELVRGDSHMSLFYHCSPYHQDSALYPIIGQLRRAAGIERDDSAEAKLDKLEVALAQSSENLANDVPLFAALLSIPGGGRHPLPNLTPQRLKERTLDALLAHLKQLALRHPILMIFEDLHWIDPTSLELLSLAIDQIKDERLLLVATARPDFTPPWPSHRHISTIALTRLDRTEGEALVEGVTGGKPLPAEVLNQILARTDGVPLFIEELTKNVLESGLLRESGDRYELIGPLPPLAIPSTLHASLLARLDRLSSIKDVAQIGATVGREFSFSLIAAVAALRDEDLKAALAQLVAAELIFQRGMPPEATYVFKHALVQDAAYSSLLRSRRQGLHGLIARTLEECFQDTVETEPQTVAHHFTKAGLAESAIDYWLKASKRALARSANAEAAKHVTQGIELVKTLSPSPEAGRKAVGLYLALGSAMIAIKGAGAAETLEAFSRARDLLEDSSTLAERINVLRGLWNVHLNRAEYIAAREAAEQCLVLAVQNRQVGAMANRLKGHALYHLGTLVDARRYLQRALDLCTVNKENASKHLGGIDDQAAALSMLSRTLWVLGYPERAAAAAAQAVARARAVGHALTTAMALNAEAELAYCAIDLKRTAIHADELMAYSVEHGLTNYEHLAQFHQATVLAMRGNPRQAIVIMNDAMTKAEKSGSKLHRPKQLCDLAAAHAKLGDPVAGLALLDKAIQEVEKTEGALYDAVLYRAQGELLLTFGKKDQAEASLKKALTVARRQDARWWELRAATSLARTLRDDGRSAEARDFLAPVYDWFTEGINLPDLQGAKGLLEQLRG